ncbi:hypothetical protein Q2T48_33990, partial [Pseudomonas aeruginosa]|uniref:hypothetical protein n=1 Tax=Pseudomonas aeruginosa TaxID=287 RepID=UPI00265FCFE4
GLDVETLLEAERARYLHGEILTERRAPATSPDVTWSDAPAWTWRPCSKPSGRATCMARSSPNGERLRLRQT